MAERTLSNGSKAETDHHEKRDANKNLNHPLAGKSRDELAALGETYARDHQGLASDEDIRAFRLGAIIAGNTDEDDDPNTLRDKYAAFEGLSDNERRALVDEVEHRWKHPFALYFLVTICSLCAVVQGMDETVVNGAQIFYVETFRLEAETERNEWLIGLMNAAPYLCCAVAGCWVTEPMNKVFGRRGTVFISCAISFVTCFWQAFPSDWWHMFIARFFLGFGIGPKSATTPMFAAECAPKQIRGALVMQWQMWTAFGIMLGYAADLAFLNVPDSGSIHGLNWRLMLASAGVPALIVCLMVLRCAESPRWYLTKDRHADAYSAMKRLRFTDVQAARDLFYAHVLLRAEQSVRMSTKNRLKEIFTLRRNRNAFVASEVVMFMQQFCGVNTLAYYSSTIFLDGGFPEQEALTASLGFGIINFLFALPAFYTIDTFGRRNLLLTTFPFLALWLLFTGCCFLIPNSSDARLPLICVGIYLFAVFYSPGEGPVPFTYSAEAYPLYIRAIGMSIATATTWFFNFILAVTWPSISRAFTITGGFAWYAAWNVIGFFLVLLFLPETKNKTLEELDAVFSVSSHRFMRYGLSQFIYFFRHYIFRAKVSKPVVPTIDDVQHDEEKP